MKTLAALIAALLLPAAALAADPAPAPARPADAAPADARLTVPVGGMTCGGCVNTVSTSLKKLEGVKSVEVSLEKKKAFVTYDASKLSAKDIVEAIAHAGFEPGLPIAN